MTAAQIGALGEEHAAKYLQRHGYRVETRNYRTRRGEVDIIAESRKYLAFVEVKTRRKGSLGTPAEAVDAHKQRRIILAAMEFLQENPTALQPRFDVIEVFVTNEEHPKVLSCNHIENAFEVN